MRPTRLELSGFTAFRELTTVDFADADLFALAGPTGAGKSTLIDAMCFALYGSVPRLDRRAVAPVISLDRNEARVRFDFTVGESSYTVARVVRRTTSSRGAAGATTKEARLENADGETLAGDADGVSRAVENLIGLGFDQFITCVVLPQGEFARFLHDTPRARQDLLVRLLDLGAYDRMRTVAHDRSTAAGAKFEMTTQRLTELDHATDAAVAHAAERVARLGALEQRAAELTPRIADLERERQRLRQALDDQRALRDRAANMALPGDVAVLDRAVTEAAEAVEAAQRQRGKAEREREAAENHRAALGDAATLSRTAALHEQRATIAARLERGERVLVERAEEAAVAEKDQAEALDAVTAAEDHRDGLRREHAAHGLRRDLVAGEPCPVCQQSVPVVPDVAAPAKLGAADREHARAAERHKGAQRSAMEALAQLRAAERLHAELASELGAIDERLLGHPGSPDIAAALAAIQAADTTVRAAVATERACVQAEQRAVAGRERARAAIEQGWSDFEAARDHLRLLEPPPADRTSLRRSWRDFATWRDGTVARLQQTMQRHTDDERHTAQQLAHLTAELRDAATAAGVPTDEATNGMAAEPGDVVAAITEAATLARASHQHVSEQRELAGRLREEAAQHRERQVVATTLARHLAANGFERWLLDEALQRLAADASVRLRELSSGQYSLAVDAQRNFAVIDHRAADERRSARTLSGGETFLASLALALALADQIAAVAVVGVARLESIFLDEGFGTLDPATLDVVASAIEELGASGRTVGIVTHVRELAERLPVRFEVSRSPAGAQVQRVEQ